VTDSNENSTDKQTSHPGRDRPEEDNVTDSHHERVEATLQRWRTLAEAARNSPEWARIEAFHAQLRDENFMRNWLAIAGLRSLGEILSSFEGGRIRPGAKYFLDAISEDHGKTPEYKPKSPKTDKPRSDTSEEF
jgi:hypothetical protein